MLTARFYDRDVNHVIDILQSAYAIRCTGDCTDDVLAEFISALEECDFIQLTDDKEALIDEG